MMRTVVHLFFVLLLAVADSTELKSEQCPAGQKCEEDDAAFMQGGLRAQPVQQHKMSWGANFFNASHLEPDPPTVPLTPGANKSMAGAVVHLYGDAVSVQIWWHLCNISMYNKVIGLHIHQGDKTTNGAILYGFCGQDPLPAFGSPEPTSCGANGSEGKGTFHFGGSVCNLDNPVCVSNGTLTNAEAANMLRQHALAADDFYLNLHTDASFEKTAGLGLLRAQLVRL